MSAIKIRVDTIERMLEGDVKTVDVETDNIDVLVGLLKENSCVVISFTGGEYDLQIMRCPSPIHALAVSAILIAQRSEEDTPSS